MSRISLPRPSRRTALITRAIVDALEPRLLMHAGHSDENPYLPATLHLDNMPAIHTTTATGTGPDVGITTNGPIAISQLQKYHSRPGTTAKLFLDFNGQNAMTWGSYNVPAQSAWSTDADTTTFSDAEQQAIYEVWARVAEKYSPFNADVTTEDPGNRTAYQTLAVVMASDDGSWLGGLAGGVAYVGSFAGGTGGNTVFVFPKNLGPYYPKYVAEAAAHESGHGFGLQHQSTWSGSTKTNEYNPGDSLTAPILGNSYSAERGLWWYGTSSVSSTSIQDDLAVISSSTNRFGYAADDHPNTVSSGDPLSLNGTSVSGYGVIEKSTDSDVFSFNTGAGKIQLTVDPAAYGPMLNLKLSLYDANGALVTSANNATFTESLNVTVNAGTYKLVVASNGAYGDLGQYRISGNIVAPAAPTLTAPTGLAAAVANGQISLAWSDTNTSESGFVIQRSTDGTTFTDYATLGANATSYVDTAVAAGGTYSYRVMAFDATTRSAASNTAAATLAPAAPPSLVASAASASQINLSWTDVNGETGFRIERSTDGTNFSTVATVGAGVLNYANTGLAASTTYIYRVIATNAGGASAASPLASATTSAAPLVTLNAPSNLTAAYQKNGRIRLNWGDTNTSESGYRVEISSDGVNFSLLANAAANSTGYQTGRLTGTYWFRVKAYNASTESAYSNVAQVVAGARAQGVLASSTLPAAGVVHTHTTARIARVFNFLAKLPARPR